MISLISQVRTVLRLMFSIAFVAVASERATDLMAGSAGPHQVLVSESKRRSC